MTISNNIISGGYYGIRLYGTTSGRNENVEISGNTITDVYYYGIYVYYGTDIIISDNTASGFGSAYAYGIYPYQTDGIQITGNHLTDVYYGVYSYYASSTSAASFASVISNNMVESGYYGLAVLYGPLPLIGQGRLDVLKVI